MEAERGRMVGNKVSRRRGMAAKALAAALSACMAAAAAAAEGSGAEVLWTATVTDGARYAGWPTLCRRASGELVVAFSGDREKHVCPWGKVQLVRSADGGRTWSSPETAVNGPLDDRDGGIMELSNGDLLLTYFTSVAFSGNNAYRRHFEKIQRRDFEEHFGNFTRRSGDGGKTWEPPVRTVGSAPHGGIQLRDGRLMMVGRASAPAPALAGLADLSPEYFHDAVVCEVSSDSGRSWKVISTLTPPEGVSVKMLYEPYVLELSDGRILAQVRYEAGSRNTLQAESSDGGLTWTRLRETELDVISHPTHLIELPDGRILCTFGRRGRDIGVFAVTSDDGGRSWNMAGAVCLARCKCWDFGYPSTARLPDGTMVTVYYVNEGETAPNAVLKAVGWRLGGKNAP